MNGGCRLARQHEKRTRSLAVGRAQLPANSRRLPHESCRGRWNSFTTAIRAANDQLPGGSGPRPGLDAQIITYPCARLLCAPPSRAARPGGTLARTKWLRASGPARVRHGEQESSKKKLVRLSFSPFFTIMIITQFPGALRAGAALKERARLSAGAGERFRTSFIHALPLPVMRAGGSFRVFLSASPGSLRHRRLVGRQQDKRGPLRVTLSLPGRLDARPHPNARENVCHSNEGEPSLPLLY